MTSIKRLVQEMLIRGGFQRKIRSAEIEAVSAGPDGMTAHAILSRREAGS